MKFTNRSIILSLTSCFSQENINSKIKIAENKVDFFILFFKINRLRKTMCFFKKYFCFQRAKKKQKQTKHQIFCVFFIFYKQIKYNSSLD